MASQPLLDFLAATDLLRHATPQAVAAIADELETRRLELAIEGNVLTDYVIENGMGNIDPERMATALEQMTLTYEFQTEPDMSLYFTDAYLPDAELLMVAPQ